MKKNAWEVHKDVWSTKAKFFAYIRGVLRRGWKTHPAKLKYIKANTIKIANPNPNGRAKTVNGGVCASCKKEFPLAKLQVNHIHEAGSLNDFNDLPLFVDNLMNIGDVQEHLSFECKECHDIITYSQRYNCSIEQARKEKMRIALAKLSVEKLQELCKAKAIDTTKKKKADLVKDLLNT